jgi:hypothetical protein
MFLSGSIEDIPLSFVLIRTVNRHPMHVECSSRTEVNARPRVISSKYRSDEPSLNSIKKTVCFL